MFPVSGEVHLRLVEGAETFSDDRLEVYRQTILSPEEREKERRFYFQRDRNRYVVTRALVRTVLASYYQVKPTHWVFDTNTYGRPMLINAPTTSPPLSFNLSHTDGLIVLAVAREGVGVDAENWVKRKAPIELAPRYFSSVEATDLARLPPSEQAERFFWYWTLKEAYIKARGMGLAIPLDQFGYTYPSDSQVCLTIDPALGDDPFRWNCALFRGSNEHLVALCCERREARAPTVRAWKSVALDGEAPVNLPVVRTNF
ncbi:MAG: 4'-phosphopantetheinyl transferase superfamily protein [Polyangiaceae bacterium]|nr:4'-phosphopantetheinyl transferase superfamily protein [Polyangiaceae bacterium]